MSATDWSVFGPRFRPYPHQVAVAQRLLEGRSVLLRAPTGSGKTEAICGPFLYSLECGGKLPDRLVYSLPMRVLATTLRDRARRWRQGLAFCQHGEEPEAALFQRPLVFATIDQSLGSFMSCPPSLPRKLGNVPAGAVLSAMLAFDEVQLLDPERALQAMFVLLFHQQRLRIPFVIATATLPDALASRLQSDFDCEPPLEVAEADIPSRAQRRVVLDLLDDPPGLPLDRILGAASGDSNVAVICNTVQRAQDAYVRIRQALKDRDVLLLHSRFLRERRRELERRLQNLCGRTEAAEGYRRAGAVVVATQIVEAGLDASFDHLFTELAPVDSIIQRAGRVARGGGEGTVTVYHPTDPEGKPADRAPYNTTLTSATAENLRGVSALDWDTEKRLVNRVLGPHLEQYLGSATQTIIRRLMGEAAFEGSQRKAQAALRTTDSCRLSLKKEPDSETARRLEFVNTRPQTLRALLSRGQLPGLLRVDVKWDEHDDRGQPLVCLIPIRDPSEIWADAHYVISPEYARHDPERGLLFEGGGEDFPLLPERARPLLPDNRRRESWTTHALNTAQVLLDRFITPQRPLWERVAEWWEISFEDLQQRLLTMAVLHDLGKLTVQWQQGAGRTPHEDPLAHSEDHTRTRLPAHATVSSHILMHEYGRREPKIATITRLAIQHHHSVGAQNTPEHGYCLLPHWRDIMANPLTQLGLPVPNLATVPDKQPTSLECSPRNPPFDPREYVTYCLASTALRCSDWIATGGDPDAPIHYEEWFRNG